jgi:hypothetical protein
MPEQIRCQIRCAMCNEWADSKIQFGSAKAFFTSSLVGNTVHCLDVEKSLHAILKICDSMSRGMVGREHILKEKMQPRAKRRSRLFLYFHVPFDQKHLDLRLNVFDEHDMHPSIAVPYVHHMLSGPLASRNRDDRAALID